MKSQGYLVNLKHFRKESSGKEYYIINYILISNDSLECFMSFISQELYNKIIGDPNIKPLSVKPIFFTFEVDSNLKAKLVDVDIR